MVIPGATAAVDVQGLVALQEAREWAANERMRLALRCVEIYCTQCDEALDLAEFRVRGEGKDAEVLCGDCAADCD